MTQDALRALVDGLANEPDTLRRRLVALAALTEALAGSGHEPVLVGGTALELFTDGGYSTSDVDLALDAEPPVEAAFARLGFEREGRFWVRPELDLYFEAPAREGLPGETAPRTVLEVEGLRVVVIGVEDLLLDRLRAAVHWKSDEDARWAGRLISLHRARLDWEYLDAAVADADDERRTLERLRETAP